MITLVRTLIWRARYFHCMRRALVIPLWDRKGCVMCWECSGAYLDWPDAINEPPLGAVLDELSYWGD